MGWWYQYRIAAVNRFGSRGFDGSTTPPVHVTSQNPQAASAPRQLVDGVWRFQADGGVHVRIEWKPPATAVIPVTEYRVSNITVQITVILLLASNSALAHLRLKRTVAFSSLA